MISYTARFLDRNRVAIREMEFRCKSAEDAIERLSFLAHHYAIELWDAEQIIWRFDPAAHGKAATHVIGTRVKPERRQRARTGDEANLRLVADAA